MFSQRRGRPTLVAILAASLVLAATVGIAGAGRTDVAPSCDQAFPFDRANFTNATKIENRWLPLTPGKQFVLEGTINPGVDRCPIAWCSPSPI